MPHERAARRELIIIEGDLAQEWSTSRASLARSGLGAHHDDQRPAHDPPRGRRWPT